MPRAPFNVLVIPFLRRGATTLFCVLRRSDEGWWQWVAGGGEDDEGPVEAALRETAEEIALAGTLYPLNSVASVPVTNFAAHHSWPRDLYVIPEHHFGFEVHSSEVRLSREHTEFRWLPYEDAFGLLRWQSNQTALWELAERLKSGGPAKAEGVPDSAQ